MWKGLRKFRLKCKFGRSPFGLVRREFASSLPWGAGGGESQGVLGANAPPWCPHTQRSHVSICSGQLKTKTHRNESQKKGCGWGQLECEPYTLSRVADGTSPQTLPGTHVQENLPNDVLVRLMGGFQVQVGDVANLPQRMGWVHPRPVSWRCVSGEAQATVKWNLLSPVPQNRSCLSGLRHKSNSLKNTVQLEKKNNLTKTGDIPKLQTLKSNTFSPNQASAVSR